MKGIVWLIMMIKTSRVAKAAMTLLSSSAGWIKVAPATAGPGVLGNIANNNNGGRMGELWLLHLLCMLPFPAPTTLLTPAWQHSLGLDLGVLAASTG
jgi:hypothetical protein